MHKHIGFEIAMGKIAADLADLAIVTSDNPRTEDPEKILADVLAGMPSDRPVKVNLPKPDSH